MPYIDERLNKVKEVILRELSRQPLRRSALGDRANLKGVSRATFERTFTILVCDGDAEKCSSEKFAPYRITEKGRKFLAWRGIV